MRKQVKIRRPKKSDFPIFQEIADGYKDNPLVDKAATASVVENDKILGLGVTRHILESVMYCRGNKKERTVALRLLLEQAILDAKKLGSNQLYVFVDSDFGNILIKHLGFKKAKGECLILDLGE